MIKYIKLLLFAIIPLLFLNSCNIDYNVRNHYKKYNEYLHSEHNSGIDNFTKVHMKDGSVYLLNTPVSSDKEVKLLTGKGVLYDMHRNAKLSGYFKIPTDSIALIETNKIPSQYTSKLSGGIALSLADLALAVVCLSVQKACFGSCPTFYYNDNDDLNYAEAEGFSSAIVPSLEYTDIDALNNPIIKDQIFSITMKNEALETHSVNQLKVLAYPRKNGESILHSVNDEFYLSNKTYEITKAEADEGNITKKLGKLDREERYSLADENNLSSKEEIILTFDNLNSSDDLGLVLNFRQSLMTTYLIYNALAYMGDEYTDYLLEYDNSHKMNKVKDGIYKELGEIEVYLQNPNSKKWELQGSFYETGPIAFNKQVLPFKNKNITSNAKVKIILNRGYWRLDYIALANLKQKVTPIELKPVACYYENQENKEALTLINNGDNHLVAYPGDVYKFHFLLPQANTDYELFLSTRGYYLEWMRKDWLKDKDLYKLYQLVNNPKTYLKNEASNYKIYEKTAEEYFWNSKIKSKIITQYEK